MTEADITQDLLKALERRLPGADIWKIADTATIGRPDIAVTWRGHTNWLEVKLLRRGTLEKCSPAIQRFMMQRLAAQSGGRAWYVVYDARNKERRTAIYHPMALVAPDPEHHLLLLTRGFDHDMVAEFLEER